VNPEFGHGASLLGDSLLLASMKSDVADHLAVAPKQSPEVATAATLGFDSSAPTATTEQLECRAMLPQREPICLSASAKVAAKARRAESPGSSELDRAGWFESQPSRVPPSRRT